MLASNRSLEAQNVSLAEEDKTLLNQNRQNQVNRFNDIRDQKRQIINQQALIEQYNKVRTPKDGTILDISTDIGVVVGKGDRLATLEVEEGTEAGVARPQTVAIAFFSPGDINRIQEGMTVEVVPGIQPRARFGGIEGKVVEVGKESIPEETINTIVGENQLLAESLANLRTTYTPTKPDKTHPVVPVRIILERDESNPTGYKWTGSEGFFFPITDGTTGETFAFKVLDDMAEFFTNRGNKPSPRSPRSRDKTSNRWMTKIGLIALALFLAVSCSIQRKHQITSARAETLRGQIIVWVETSRRLPEAQIDREQKVLRDILENFHELHPHAQIFVEFLPANKIWEQFESQVNKAAGPDILLIQVRPEIVQFIQAGALRAIEDSSIEPSQFRSEALKQVLYQGQLYGIPLYLSTQVLCYNRDKVSELPSTLSELIEQARKGDPVAILLG